MNNNLKCYESISIEMLELLTEFSEYINQITILNDLLLTDDMFNKNHHFNQYIYYFNIGRYYHFRCMGYMECLVLTKCYSVGGLCYWKDTLVMPAYENIMTAIEHLSELESNNEIYCNPTFKVLLKEIEGLMGVAMEIMKTIKYYNLSC